MCLRDSAIFLFDQQQQQQHSFLFTISYFIFLRFEFFFIFLIIIIFLFSRFFFLSYFNWWPIFRCGSGRVLFTLETIDRSGSFKTAMLSTHIGEKTTIFFVRKERKRKCSTVLSLISCHWKKKKSSIIGKLRQVAALQFYNNRWMLKWESHFGGFEPMSYARVSVPYSWTLRHATQHMAYLLVYYHLLYYNKDDCV